MTSLLVDGPEASLGAYALQLGLFEGRGLRDYVDASLVVLAVLVLVGIATRWSGLSKQVRVLTAYLAGFYLLIILERVVPLVVDTTLPLWASLAITLGYIGFALLGAYLLFSYRGSNQRRSSS